MMIQARKVRTLGSLFTAAVVAAGAFTAITFASTPATAAAGGTGTGYLHTSGNQILDSTGATVRLTGLNWFGMETDNHTFHGLWAGKPASWTQQIDHMAALGYNTIRVPYTGSSIAAGTTATSINTDTNPDLIGLSPLQILDKVIGYAGAKGMRIILDRHRPTTAGQTALWNGAGVTEASEIADWRTLATRYANNPVVVGADLFNEPHADGTDPQGTGADWGGGDARDWRLAAERIGNAILATQPNWLIIVEGVSCNLPSGGTPNVWDSIPDDPMACDWWGGNLSLAGQYPVRLNVANRLVYSAHDYGISVYDHQPWFDTTANPTFPANLPAVWDHFWGYLYKQNIAPVLVGEFGSTLADPRDTQWMTALMAYMGTGVNGMSFTYWAWNPDSGDTGGIVGDDWTTVDQAKQAIIGPYLIPPVAGATSTPNPTASSPADTGSCSASYTTVNSYSGGFQGQVVVTAGSSAITHWTASWTLASGQAITQLWSGALTTSGSGVTVSNLAYNGALAAGAATTFGFNATGTATTPSVNCSTA